MYQKRGLITWRGDLRSAVNVDAQAGEIAWKAKELEHIRKNKQETYKSDENVTCTLKLQVNDCLSNDCWEAALMSLAVSTNGRRPGWCAQPLAEAASVHRKKTQNRTWWFLEKRAEIKTLEKITEIMTNHELDESWNRHDWWHHDMPVMMMKSRIIMHHYCYCIHHHCCWHHEWMDENHEINIDSWLILIIWRKRTWKRTWKREFSKFISLRRFQCEFHLQSQSPFWALSWSYMALSMVFERSFLPNVSEFFSLPVSISANHSRSSRCVWLRRWSRKCGTVQHAQRR